MHTLFVAVSLAWLPSAGAAAGAPWTLAGALNALTSRHEEAGPLLRRALTAPPPLNALTSRHEDYMSHYGSIFLP